MGSLNSRLTVILLGIGIIAAFLTYAFWPRPVLVDQGEVVKGHMMVTIDEEAKTRVRDSYVVSAPFTGRLLRIGAEPGDTVVGDQTVVARLLPTNPTVLDVRTEEQAKASVEAAQAALEFALANVKKAAADADFAKREVERTQTLRKTDIVSQAALDSAERSWRAAEAGLETANADVVMRRAELANAQAMLMSFSDAQEKALNTNPHPDDAIAIDAPVSGCVLRVLQESETIISAGSPILEIGDPQSDLEIVAELLSTDAVKVSVGDRVVVDGWGGDYDLEGVVHKVEPWGFTKYSALGVEEQRVNVVVTFSGQPELHKNLGHGFRTNVKIVVWEKDDAVMAPASALFRADRKWFAFKVVGGRAERTLVEIGQNNGLEAEILSGLTEGETLVLYPSNELVDGMRLAAREAS